MSDISPDLVALLGSRICHDLISPISAIGNGVELLMMSGVVPGPELALISESVTNANARIRFFRIAFGAAAPGQSIARAEIRGMLEDMTRGGRLRIDWEASGDPGRIEAKLALLAVQCLESALPYGGRIVVSHRDGAWRVTAEAASIRAEPQLWARLSGDDLTGEVTPARVQFLLLPLELSRQGRKLSLRLAETSISLVY